MQQCFVSIWFQEIGSDIENAGSVEEDGFYPLPDTASELSDGDGPRFEMDGDNSPLVEDFHSHHIPKLQVTSNLVQFFFYSLQIQT